MQKNGKNSFVLREIKLEVTHRCLLDCIHCSSVAGNSCYKEMNRGDCLRILKEAIQMGVEEIAFSGGEPLLWPYINDAVQTARSGNIRVFIYTSGNVPQFKEKIRWMKDFGVDRCIFSIFAGNPKLHEAITRVKNSFDNTINAIKTAANAGLSTEIHFVPFSSNYKELKTITNFVKELGVSRISILRFVPQGRGEKLRSQVLTRQQNLELKKMIEDLRLNNFDIRTGSPYNFLLINDNPQCYAGIDRINIAPDLRVYPCDAFKQLKVEDIVGTLQFSSLKFHSLETCWNNSPYLNTVRKYLATPFVEPCESCEHLKMCRSGCLAQKILASGKVEKIQDPFCLFKPSS